MAQKAIFAIVHGVVQGVGFRYHTRKTALSLGLSGTVRNLPSGEVEVFAEGPASAVDELALWLRRGPALSRVSRVDVRDAAPGSGAGDFCIIG